MDSQITLAVTNTFHVNLIVSVNRPPEGWEYRLMTNDEIAAIVVDTARTTFKQPNLEYEPALAFRSIANFDSVRAIQFILATEKAFGIMIAEDEVDRMLTLGDLMTILISKDLCQS